MIQRIYKRKQKHKNDNKAILRDEKEHEDEKEPENNRRMKVIVK